MLYGAPYSSEYFRRQGLWLLCGFWGFDHTDMMCFIIFASLIFLICGAEIDIMLIFRRVVMVSKNFPALKLTSLDLSVV